MAIYRTEKIKNYTVISNDYILDNRLSLKAKGLLTYFLSRPDDWQFYTNEIVKHCSNGEKSVTSAIKELIKYGYIVRALKTNEHGFNIGGYDYSIYEKSIIVDNEKENSDDRDRDFENVSDLEESNNDQKSNRENGERYNGECQKPNSKKPNAEKPNSEKGNCQKGGLLNTENILNTEYIISTENILNTENKLNTKTIEKTDINKYISTTTTTTTPPIFSSSQKTESGKMESGEKLDNEYIYEFYVEAGFGDINVYVKNILDNLIEKYSQEAVKESIIIALKNNKYKLSYVEGVLRNHYSEQIIISNDEDDDELPF